MNNDKKTLQMMEFLHVNRAPGLPPEALADVFDQLIWCMADNGAALLKVREDWLRSDDKSRVEIALAMNETYPFDEPSEMEKVFSQISAKWPELSARCQQIKGARGTHR
jgi:hypothetical protein